MKFGVFTNVEHVFFEGTYYSYGPFIKEMNLWLKPEDTYVLIAPIINNRKPNPIELALTYPTIVVIPIPSFNISSLFNVFIAITKMPIVFYKLLKTMAFVDHIHLRCPNNIGLISSVCQIFFPRKVKTAKYAGNWDWNSKQPYSYRLQQMILRNPIITKKMTVLVYGDWPDKTKNIRSFFTATFKNEDRELISPRKIESNQKIKLVFIGALSPGKRPLLSIMVSQELNKIGILNELHLYGEGKLRGELEFYIAENQLNDSVCLHGNVPNDEIKMALKESHFLIFISKSEGWPKAVAEAMWWGCLPVTTRVSCVPQMVGEGSRGLLINENLDTIIYEIRNCINNLNVYKEKCEAAMLWSREYTIEKFQLEISNLVYGSN